MSSTDSAFSSLGLFSRLGGDGRFSPIIISANSIFDTLFACTVSIYFPALITDISSAISSAVITNAVSQASVTPSGKFELELYVKTGLGNGDQSFNPWLHELPDPISKMTYDNYIAMNPVDVLELFDLEDN